MFAHVERLADGAYAYSYVVNNSRPAALPIESWKLRVAQEDRSVQTSLTGWDVARSKTAIVSAFPGPFQYTWVEFTAMRPEALIPENGSQGPFTIRSDSAPGLTEFWARGKIIRPYDPSMAAGLPKKLAEELARTAEGAFRGVAVLTIGPWFPPGTSLKMIVSNFQSGINRLTHYRELDHNSPFVAATLATLESFQRSGETAAFFQVNGLDFLSLAAPGLETEVANALRLALTR